MLYGMFDGPILITLFIAVLLAVSYTLIVIFKARSTIWSWWHRFVSTLVSVLLGVVVAGFMFQYQKELHNDAERSRYEELLKTELHEIFETLQPTNELSIKIGDKKYSAHAGLTQSVIIEESIRSGLFSEEQTRDLLRVARSMRVHDIKVQNLLNVFSNLQKSPEYQITISSATEMVNNSNTILINDITDSVEKVGF